MHRQIMGFAAACLAVTGLWSCSPAAQVKEDADAPTPTAPAFAEVPEPGAKDADAPMEFTTTESGLKYRVLRKGTGKTPGDDSTVVVNYKGWIDNPDQPFDQSYGRGEFTFRMNPPEVIGGWIEGVRYLSEGGMIELQIPPDLAYGANGYPPVIPPNSTLTFIVELIAVK